MSRLFTKVINNCSMCPVHKYSEYHGANACYHGIILFNGGAERELKVEEFDDKREFPLWCPADKIDEDFLDDKVDELEALLAEVRQGLVAQKELWDMAKINLEAYDKSMGCVPFMAVHDPIILINSLIAEIDEVTK